MVDAIDLSTAVIHHSPPDIASWPITRTITRLQMSTTGGLTLTFDQPLLALWKWPSNPAKPDENFQYTVWACVQLQGVWHAAGFVQMWEGRPMGNRELPPILTNYVNWWGDPRRLWGEMSDYVPKAGDTIGFFVSAGNARLVDGVTSVRERSNTVRVTLPANDSGDFVFAASGPQPEPTPEQPPLPSEPNVPPEPSADTLRILAAMAANTAALDNLTEQLRLIRANGVRVRL